MSYFNTEVLPKLGAWYRPLLGWDQYNKKNVDEAAKGAAKVVDVVEEHLLHNTYLVGERITLADLFAASIISRGFQFFFDKEWRSEHPNVSRWFETVVNQEIYKAVVEKTEFVEKAIPNTPPKKEQAEKPKKEQKEQPKKQVKTAAEAEEEEDEAPQAPKPKHPLEALPKPTFVLDDMYVLAQFHDCPQIAY